MKTIICEKPNHFQLAETKQKAPSAKEAVVKIRRIGICGTDIHAYQGNQPFFEYPRILGHELSGEIVQLPEGGSKSSLKVGDQVSIIPYIHCGGCGPCRSGKTNCCTRLKVLGVHHDGGMREYLNVPVDHLIAANQISLEQAGIVECFSIGAHAVTRAAIQPGEKVLVIGAGPIGLGAMKYAGLAGADVIAMDLDAERLEFCSSWVPVKKTVQASSKAYDVIYEWTGGDMPDVVLDATGNKISMTNAFDLVAYGGRLVYIGLFKGDITFSDPEFHKKELTLMGSRNATRSDFEKVIASMASGEIDTDSFITHHTTIDRMIDDFPKWLNEPGAQMIKSMIHIS